MGFKLEERDAGAGGSAKLFYYFQTSVVVFSYAFNRKVKLVYDSTLSESQCTSKCFLSFESAVVVVHLLLGF